MRLNVDEVDLYSIRELADASTHDPDESWLTALCDPTTGISYRSTITLLGNIVSNMIGSGIVLPDRVYRVGINIPTGATVGTYTDTDGVEKGYIHDPYLDGKVYSVNRRGTELMMKGVEWDNDILDKQVRLLLSDGENGDVFSEGEVVIIQFQPQISPIISAPNAIARFTSGVQTISGNTTLTASTYRKLLVITSPGIITLGSDYPENVLCAFTQNTVWNGQSTITAPAGQSIAFNGSTVSAIWLGKNERLGMIRVGNVWYVVYDHTGYDKIGTIVAGRLVGPNQVIAQGQTLLRADYPRLVDYLNRLNAAYPGSVVSAALWPSNRTLWGFGNGTTTIQVPDLRGRFTRWLDLGAGIDVDRVSAGTGSRPGSYQADMFKRHSHIVNVGDNVGLSDNANDRNVMLPGNRNVTSSEEGGNETRPINIGELPLINV